MSNNDRRQRIREQMREFYGDPNANSASKKANEGQRRNPNVPPEMDLDSEFFSVGKYTTDLLRRESLRGLVESDTELLRSVRRLDGELQELVYRNYAKFISAADTIREMRDNVTEMDTKLQALSGNVTTIDTISQQVSEQLQVHRSQIEETISANRMLKKVQFLVGLPTTMRRLIDRQEYNLCVKYWVAGDGFLAKHASIASIAKIQQQCRALAQELYTKMEEGMCAIPLDDPEAMENIRKYVEDLRLLRATSLITASAKGAAAADDSASFEEGILKTLMRSVSANYQSGLAAVQRDLRSATAIPDFRTIPLDQRDEPLSQANLREALAELKSTCALLSVNSERVYALLNQLEGSSVAMRVAQEVQPTLVDLLGPLARLVSELMVASFVAIADDAGSAMLADASQAEVVKAVLQNTVNALMRQVKHIVVTLKTLGANYLDTAHSQQSKAYALLVDQSLCEVLQRCVTLMQEKARQGPTAAVLAATSTPSSVNRVLQQSQQQQQQQTSSKTAESGTASSRLAVSAHMQRMSFCLSRFVYATVGVMLQEAVSTQLVAVDVVHAERVADVSNALGEAAKELQHRGVVLLGQVEAISVQFAAFGSGSGDAVAGAASHTQQPPPPAPAIAQGGQRVPTCLADMLAEMAIVYRVLQVLPPPQSTKPSSTAANTPAKSLGSTLGGGASPYGGPTAGGSRLYGGGEMLSTGPSSGHGRGSNLGGARGSSGARGLVVSYTRRDNVTLQSSVDRIFSNESAVLHTIPRDGRAATTIACTLLYILKAIVEAVRLSRGYDSDGFQRVQVSCLYVLKALLSPARGTAPREWLKAWDDLVSRTIQQLLDEICCCAYERYEAKVPLPQADLDRIVSEALGHRPPSADLSQSSPPTGISSPPPPPSLAVGGGATAMNSFTPDTRYTSPPTAMDVAALGSTLTPVPTPSASTTNPTPAGTTTTKAPSTSQPSPSGTGAARSATATAPTMSAQTSATASIASTTRGPSQLSSTRASVTAPPPPPPQAAGAAAVSAANVARPTVTTAQARPTAAAPSPQQPARPSARPGGIESRQVVLDDEEELPL